jgi:hypothetical protein
MTALRGLNYSYTVLHRNQDTISHWHCMPLERQLIACCTPIVVPKVEGICNLHPHMHQVQSHAKIRTWRAWNITQDTLFVWPRSVSTSQALLSAQNRREGNEPDSDERLAWSGDARLSIEWPMAHHAGNPMGAPDAPHVCHLRLASYMHVTPDEPTVQCTQFEQQRIFCGKLLSRVHPIPSLSQGLPAPWPHCGRAGALLCVAYRNTCCMGRGTHHCSARA